MHEMKTTITEFHFSIITSSVIKMEMQSVEIKKKVKTYCAPCRQKFSSPYAYKRHHERIHTRIRCSLCPQICRNKEALKKHKAMIHKKFQCPHCDKRLSRKSVLTTHIADVHSEKNAEIYACTLCKINLKTEKEFNEHMNNVHTRDYQFKLYKQALDSSLQSYRNYLRIPYGLEKLLSKEHFNNIVNFIKDHRIKHPFFKVSFCTVISFTTAIEDRASVMKQIPLRIASETITLSTNINRLTKRIINELIQRAEDVMLNGSGEY